MGGNGVMRGDATSSQSGQEAQEGHKKGAQQEVTRKLEAPADGRHRRDLIGWRFFCNDAKGMKGGSGRMPTARNNFSHLETKSLRERVVIFSEDIILAIRVS
jgi:hypothetical protein